MAIVLFILSTGGVDDGTDSETTMMVFLLVVLNCGSLARTFIGGVRRTQTPPDQTHDHTCCVCTTHPSIFRLLSVNPVVFVASYSSVLLPRSSVTHPRTAHATLDHPCRC